MPTTRAAKAKVKLFPYSKKQQMLSTWWIPDFSPISDYDCIIVDGAIRSGKTMVGSMSFVIWAMYSHDKKAFGMAGKSLDSFKRNVWVPLQQWFSDVGIKVSRLSETTNGYILRYSYYINIKTNKTIEDLEILKQYIEYTKQQDKLKRQGLLQTDSSEIIDKRFNLIRRIEKENYFYLFGGKDEGSAAFVQGFTSAGFYFDECALMPESFVNQCVARCSEEGAKYWFNCNPEGPQHWFKLNWIDQLQKKNAYRIQFKMDDNPSLSERTLQRYKNQWEGVFYKRFILGEWVIAEGVVYPMFDAEKHTVEPEQMPKINQYEELYISIDYGTQNPCVFCLWGVYKGIHYLVKEYYHDGRTTNNQKTDEEYYNDLVDFAKDENKDLLIKKLFIDPSAASFITLIRRKGRFIIGKTDNSKLDGIRECSTCLSQGLFKFNKKCNDCLDEFPKYMWDEKATKRGEEEPIKMFDHFMDAWRYYVKSMKIAYPEFKRLGM